MLKWCTAYSTIHCVYVGERRDVYMYNVHVILRMLSVMYMRSGVYVMYVS